MRLDFERLPAAVRDRLTQRARMDEKPYPILFDRGAAVDPLLGHIGSAVLALIGVAILVWWLGEIPWHEREGVFAIDFVIVFTIAWGIGSSIRRTMLDGVFPFPRGVYVFPTDVVDARGTTLGVAPLAETEVRRVRIVGPGTWSGREEKGRIVRLVPREPIGDPIVFAQTDHGDVMELGDRLEAVRAAAPAAIGTDDDVFREARDGSGRIVLSDRPSPEGTHGRPIPLPFRHPWLVALLLAVVVGAAHAAWLPEHLHGY
jgi:hypothetical protein